MSSPFAYFPIRFDRNARVIAPGDIALRAFLKKAASQTTDLIVICHGWNLSLIHISEPTRPY